MSQQRNAKGSDCVVQSYSLPADLVDWIRADATRRKISTSYALTIILEAYRYAEDNPQDIYKDPQ